MATMAGAVLERWKVGLVFLGGKLCSGGGRRMSTVEVSEKEVSAEEDGGERF